MSEQDENIVYLTCNVNEVYSSTEVLQNFINPLSNPIELSISFPFKQEIQINKFTVTIGNKKIISKILSKEKAEEKYSDSISSGNTGFIGNYSDDGWNYTVLIGNISPKEKVILETSFLQLLTSNDMSYELSIMENYPSFQYKEMNQDKPDNKIVKGKIIIKTLSKITRLISFFLDEENKKNSKINFKENYMEAIIEFEKEANLKKKIEINKPIHAPTIKPHLEILARPQFFPPNIIPKSFIMKSDAIQPSFSILFRTEKMNIPMIYSQFDPEKKQTAYVCNFVYSSDDLIKIPIPDKPDEDNKISYYNSFQNNKENDTPGLFIFLIDQSGSMRGKSIELVKQALLLFIQSLPPKSYFQLIGFGSDFKYYNETPVEYNKENVKIIIQVINNLKANMGGTNISTPLKDIFSNKNYDNINLAKNIFLLTDGQVHDREECINSISANNSRFRIQSIGIGNDFDRILIERCGKLGKGSSSFVINVEELNHVVIDTLNKCLRPYLTKINFDVKQINKIHIMPFLDNISYQDDIINFAFISNEKKEGPIDINLKANDTKNDINKDFKVDKIINLEPGEQLNKIIISNLLKISKDIKEEEEIKLSKEYQVLSKNTSLFGEILKNGSNKEGNLIKVELNQNEKRRFGGVMMKNKILMGNRMMLNKCMAMPTKMMAKCAMPKGNLVFEAPMAKKSMAMRKLNNECSMASREPIKKQFKKYEEQEQSEPFESEEKGAIPDTILNCVSSMNKESIEKKNIKKSNNDNGNDLNKLIISQDIIEGFWDENENSLLIKNKINDIFCKIENFVNADNGIKDKKKVIFTILVLYYLLNDMKEKIDELRLIINKGKKYLKSINYNYDAIVQKIGI